MFTQFFGSYLLNQKLVSPQELAEALTLKKDGHVKLGVLAIHENYLTPAQVDELHMLQMQVDKRFGDLAVEKQYLTETQVTYLLGLQKSEYLLLGQALIDHGVMSNSEFAQALNTYKALHEMEDLDAEVGDFMEVPPDTTFNQYLQLLVRNLIRFIGNDFVPGEIQSFTEGTSNKIIYQRFKGDMYFTVALEMDEQSTKEFGKRFAGEDFVDNAEYWDAAVGEFLNLQDGLFCVNLSNEYGIELDLEPQGYMTTHDVQSRQYTYALPLYFSFGTVRVYLDTITLKE